MKPIRLLMVSEPGIDGVFAIVDAIVRQIFRDHPEITVDLAFSSRRTGPALNELVREIERRNGQTIRRQGGRRHRPIRGLTDR